MYVKIEKLDEDSIFEVGLSVDGTMFTTILLSKAELREIARIFSDPVAFEAAGWYTISTLEA